MKKQLLFLFLLLNTKLFAQSLPWQQPLKIAWSGDGISFNTSSIFQDSAGVPSVIKWKEDTLIAVFQWFRAPQGSPTWDKVAVKFSYDNGINWTNPAPIEINGLPANYQRPFDPTLIKLANDSLRIYFSSSNGIPAMGLDSSVNTYSAISNDGVHYTFESNARVDEPDNKVIDPAVIFFNNAFHYLAPIGSPQQGAYHYVSPNGINFTKVPDINSDISHNWTGNYMVNDSNDLRFYGSGGQSIWFNSSSNGGVWNGYVNTNIAGGDPSVLRISNNNYLMIYVGTPNNTGIYNPNSSNIKYHIFPNPSNQYISIYYPDFNREGIYNIYNISGQCLLTGQLKNENTCIDIHYLSAGLYVLIVDGRSQLFEVLR